MFHLGFELTRRCNLKCAWCGRNKPHKIPILTHVEIMAFTAFASYLVLKNEGLEQDLLDIY